MSNVRIPRFTNETAAKDPDVCLTISGNFRGEIDPNGSVYNSRHIPRSVVHRKTAFCIDFILIWDVLL